MKTLHLYYFSGTGATALVAELLARGMTARGYDVDRIPIEAVVRGERSVPAGKPDLAGFGAPVIGFGTPRIVRRFLRTMPRMDGVPAFVFRTAGGASPINARASVPMARGLRRKGCDPFYERCFALASNWISAHEPAVVHRLRRATERKIESTCDALAAGTERKTRTRFAGRVALDMLRAVSGPGIRLLGRDLGASAACTACGLCARRCPAGNIVMKDGKPRFGSECTTCLRCVYSCPSKAIKTRHLKPVSIPGGYDFSRAQAEAEARKDETPVKVPPFLAAYEADIDS